MTPSPETAALRTRDTPLYPVTKVSVTINGQATSVSLEKIYITYAQEIAKGRQQSLSEYFSEIDRTRPPAVNLSSAIRQHVLSYLEARIMQLSAGISSAA